VTQQTGQRTPARSQERSLAGAGRAAGKRFAFIGAAVTTLGAILLVISFTALEWFSPQGIGHSQVSRLRLLLDQAGPAATAESKAYFGWLGATLAVVVVLAALLASLPVASAKALRVIAPITAAAAIVMTFLAIRLFTAAGGAGATYADYLDGARLGFYFAVAGFLLAGLGAVLAGHRRVGPEHVSLEG